MRGVRLRSRTCDHRRCVICRGYRQRTSLRIVATVSLTRASRCLCSNESGNPFVRWIAPTQRGVIVASSKPPWTAGNSSQHCCSDRCCLSPHPVLRILALLVQVLPAWRGHTHPHGAGMGAWTDLPCHEIPAPEPIKVTALATLPDFLVSGAAFVVVARARRSSNSRV